MISLSDFSPDLTIDGSYGEGGGSILRLAIGMACVLHKSVLITRIRANRKRPGLRLQHLVGIQALKEITQGETNQLAVGTTEVAFRPGNEWKSTIEVSIQTAGSIGMLAQTLYNGLYFAPMRSEGYKVIVQGGGTYGKFAPGVEYLNNVTFAILRRLGYPMKIEVTKQGFYPKGCAEATILIHPQKEVYHSLSVLQRGKLSKIGIRVHSAIQLKKPRVAERIIESFWSSLTNFRPISSSILDSNHSYQTTASIGVAVDVWIEFDNQVILGSGTVLGERGVSSEKIGNRLAAKINAMLDQHNTLDEFTADQILPYLCLCKAASTFRIQKPTRHFTTNLYILELFTGRKAQLHQDSHGYLVSYPEKN